MEQITLNAQIQNQLSQSITPQQQTAHAKRYVKAPVMVLLLSSILSSQIEAQPQKPSHQESYTQLQSAYKSASTMTLGKAEQEKMAAVIQGLPGLSKRQKRDLVKLYVSSQAKLNQLRGSMLNLNQKQSTMTPGHYQYQAQMENIVALKASLAKEHKALKSQFKRQLIQLLTPKQRQQLQSAIQQKHANAKGIDKSWM